MIAGYGGALFGVMFLVHGADGLAELGENHDPLRAQAIGFLSLTLPVVLYFACFDSRARAGTLGKRLVGVRVVGIDGVRATFGRTLLRAAIKFLPWEFGHLFAHNLYAHGTSTPDAPVPVWFWVPFVLAMGGASIYAASLFVGVGATP